MIEQALITRLLANSTVAGYVGSNAATARIRTGSVPSSDVRPYLHISTPQGDNPVTFNGATTLRRDTVQVVAVANTRSDAKRLSDATLAVLNGFNGTVTGTASGTVRIKGIFHQGDQDDEAGPEPGSQTAAPYAVSKEFLVCYAITA